MNGLVIVAIVAVLLILLASAIRSVKQYERGVLFRLGRVPGVREPGLRLIIPIADVLRRVHALAQRTKIDWVGQVKQLLTEMMSGSTSGPGPDPATD
ncbi:hypothetical protein [Amycolatopsis sp. NPDC051061]|uniref:hypothetical protein n=1 Tax=Amycolatopsis sp. NPDC051061 TaxID=3155042 RepID=UPI0034244A8E